MAAAALWLFASTAKLAGAIVAVAVAANAFSYSRFRRANLRQFKSPIDESSEVLADFQSLPADQSTR